MDKPLILGRYRPLETTGTGGSGTVELAYDTRIQRRVAIKRIPLGNDADEKAPGLTEARTAAMLAHPNIVSVYDFDIDDDEAYLIMEFVDGATLAEAFVLEDRFLSLDEIAAVTKSVAAALDYAHQNQVLHLDIKPANILIDRSGTVKVADFGIAELADAAGWHEAQGGTVGFMPPEQICGEELDQRTDEWALACVVYQMLTGENPFLAPTPEKSLNKIEGGDITPPSAFRPELDPAIDAVILDALSPSRDVRYETILAFARELLPLLGNPEDGRTQLAELLAEDEEEEDHEEEDRGRIGLWDRLGQKGADRIGRALTAIGGAWLSYISLTAAEIPFAAVIAIMAAVIIGAFLAPALGSILAVLAVTIGLLVSGQYAFGAVFGVIGIVWWVFIGRRKPEDIAAAWAAPICLVTNLFALYPLAVGFSRPPVKALIATAFGALLAITSCGLTDSYWIMKANWWPGWAENSTFNLHTLIASPYTWVMLAGWVVSALLMAVLCTRGNKVVSILGTVIGCAVMSGTLVLAEYLAGGHVWALPSQTPCIMILVALIVMCVATALGAPCQGEYDNPEE